MSEITCLEFRRRVGAEAECRDEAIREHAAHCPSCRGFQEEMHEFNRKLREAFRVPVPEGLASRVRLGAAFRPRPRTNWMAAAAGLVMAIAAVFAVNLGGNAQALDSAIIGHIYHEPNLLVETDRRVDRARIARVLERVGFELRGEGLEGVSHAGLCYFRGRLVSHLVVRGQDGPVTVLALPEIGTDSATRFEEDGFRGTIVPVERGSIAIIGRTKESLEDARSRIAGRIARAG